MLERMHMSVKEFGNYSINKPLNREIYFSFAITVVRASKLVCEKPIGKSLFPLQMSGNGTEI